MGSVSGVLSSHLSCNCQGHGCALRPVESGAGVEMVGRRGSGPVPNHGQSLGQEWPDTPFCYPPCPGEGVTPRASLRFSLECGGALIMVHDEMHVCRVCVSYSLCDTVCWIFECICTLARLFESLCTSERVASLVGDGSQTSPTQEKAATGSPVPQQRSNREVLSTGPHMGNTYVPLALEASLGIHQQYSREGSDQDTPC